MIVDGRRVHPGRRRDHRRRRVGRRVGDHRRVGAGHPRVGRRPLGGHRRHARAVGLDQGPASRPIPGETFLDRMIALVEGAERQKTPNEIALNILLAGLTIIFLLAVVTLQPFAIYSGAPQSVFVLVVAAGLPDPDDDRRAAVGDRHRRHGPAGAAQRAGDVRPRGRSGRRRPHAAARQDRHDHARQPPGDRVPPAAGRQRGGSSPTPRSSRRSPTRRRKGARSSCWRRRSTASADASCRRSTATFVPFTAQTRMSGVDLRRPRRSREGRRRTSRIRKGATMRSRSGSASGGASPELAAIVDRIARAGGTPLVVAERHARARRHPPEGHRQGRHPRALRAPARDGHQDGDDHRRQPADRRGDRGRSGRRRLPRRGDAGRQDGADQARAGATASSSR